MFVYARWIPRAQITGLIQANFTRSIFGVVLYAGYY